ncbi:MAG: hypothetical protein IIA67_07510 [Planctomycetes bacterium]|nr:hypothetical protein [Planctomycetota bacterium]
MDPFRFIIAMGPLAIYMILLGYVNLRRSPLVTTGTRDMALLGFAIVGFVIVGPMELFMPQEAVNRFGGAAFVWLLLVGFYGLCATLYILLARPRLIVYNVTLGHLRPILADLAATLDQSARWAGDSLVMPQYGVQLHLDAFPAMRTVTLKPNGVEQSISGWRRLDADLSQILHEAPVSRNPLGYALIVGGLLILFAALGWIVWQPELFERAMRQMRRL